VWAELLPPISVHDWAGAVQLIDQAYERSGWLPRISRRKRKFEISAEKRPGKTITRSDRAP
jgi:hypothetical protein